MATKKYGIKVIRRYAPALFITSLLLLIMIALPVLNIWFPYFKGSDPNNLFSTSTLVGDTKYFQFGLIDLVKGALASLGILKEAEGETTIISDLILFTSSTPTSQFGQISKWIILGEVLILAIMAIVAVIFVFMVLKYCLFGKSNNYGTAFQLGIFYLILGLVYVGGAIALSILYGNEYGTLAEVKVDFTWPIVIGSGLVLSEIALIVVYVVCFNGKPYSGDVVVLSDLNEDEKKKIVVDAQTPNVTQPVVVNVNNPAPVSSPIVNPVEVKTEEKKIPAVVTSNATLSNDVNYIGGHQYSHNRNLIYAVIPEGVPSIGPGAFSNCLSLKMVTIPSTVKSIGYNCFFNCINLERIVYNGNKASWTLIKRGSNWLTKAKTCIVVCTDGQIIVDPTK